MIVKMLTSVARHGQVALVLGLLAGFLLKDLAAALKPWLPEMVAGLLFLTAFRIGAPRAFGGLKDGVSSLKSVLILQMLLPMLAVGLFWLLGLSATPLAVALVLMLAAPSVTGSPNITQLLGHAPEPAFRLLILGTALMPLTVIPVFLLSPDLGSLWHVLTASFRLTGTIALTVGLAFACRHWFARDLSERRARAVDGLTILALMVIVIGLMAALGPALYRAPFEVAQWLAVVLVANLGLQYLCFRWLLWRGAGNISVPTAVVAGNRNFALFLIALPASTTDPLLIFLGCYQVPMYLTAMVMRPIYARAAQPQN
ncbi:hypothetical protein PH5382_02036 [Phaeobacter sp. CECT 5382]|uniref:hypothetical protein n=1 Tax=Phaeobacter sp. CECT 5382 TaxID=1712645 RepID=UPI0006DA7250|nr:hypothetical protein [Phaeobacter sp. CECT 5382]CUH88104.1 hypothetical protein PH5382_02036 [Phaeobacter sp. CECT 5382]